MQSLLETCFSLLLLFFARDLISRVTPVQHLFLLSFAAEDIPVVESDGGPLTIKVEEGILVLTEDNFDLVVLSKAIILVQFYAEWCVHCRALAKEFVKAAKMLAKEDPKAIPLAKVDAVREEVVARRLGVTSFPTLFVFSNGSHEEYDGSRTAQGIVDYMRRRADPQYKPLAESVISLDEHSFDTWLSRHNLSLVVFTRLVNCVHCQRLAPELERAAKELFNSAIPVAIVDAVVNAELVQRFHISSYPTLKVFRALKDYTYSDVRRDENSIVNHMRREAITPSTLITSIAQLKRHLAPDWPTVVGFLSSASSSPLWSLWTDAAFEERHRNYRFVHISDDSLRHELSEANDSLVLFSGQWFVSEFEPSRHRLPLDPLMTVKDVLSFVENNSRPLVGHRRPATEWLYANAFPKVVVYYDVDMSDEHRTQTQLIRKQVLAIGHQFRSITFCIAREDDYSQELRELSFEDSGEDINVGFFAAPKVRYAMSSTERFDQHVLRAFVEQVLNGSVARAIRSQPLPEENQWMGSEVVTVVGQTMDQIVTKSEKNVLIEFFAQYSCEECRRLETVFRRLASKFAHNKEVVFARIESTLNDIPEEYLISVFPTIYWSQKGDRSRPVVYAGDHTLEDMSRFVDQMLAKKEEEERDEL